VFLYHTDVINLFQKISVYLLFFRMNNSISFL